MPIYRRISPLTYLALSSIALFPVSSFAGSARDYLNAPIDSWLGFYNAGYSSSVTPEDGMDITSDVRANVLSQSFMLTRTMDYWGRTGGLSLVLPYRYVETHSGDFRASTRGISDIGMLWQINLFGGPALSREQFRSFIPETFSSFHFYLGTPLGEYNAHSALNPSSNRWVFSPTVNYSYTPDQGWTWLETYITTTVFTTNDNYLVGGASKLAQDPLMVIEGHASRNMTPDIWLSLDSYYNVGGETHIDNTSQDNAANTLRLGTGIGIRAWGGGDIIINYERVVAKPSQQPESQTLRMTLRQFW